MAHCLSGCFAVQLSSGLVKIHVITVVFIIMIKCVKDIGGGGNLLLCFGKSPTQPKEKKIYIKRKFTSVTVTFFKVSFPSFWNFFPQHAESSESTAKPLLWNLIAGFFRVGAGSSQVVSSNPGAVTRRILLVAQCVYQPVSIGRGAGWHF